MAYRPSHMTSQQAAIAGLRLTRDAALAETQKFAARQQTHIFAAAAQAALQHWTVRASDTNAQIALIAGLSQPDTAYAVICTPVGYSGGVPAGAFTVVQVVKDTSYFSVSTLAAPGAGNWVDWDFVLVRPAT